MPRANRYILPGYAYHLTHRCHDRKFLLRFRIDRIEYYSRMRTAAHKHHISIFAFCITCNHVHMLVMCNRINDLSRFMQQLEGEFAQYYNSRKNRSGAYWGERFHCTMIDSGEYLWNCLRYIDLNMVRARVVGRPSEWTWCSYRELVGLRKRFRLLDLDRLARVLGLADRMALAEIHQQRISDAINDEHLAREKFWTESIAVGSEAFLLEIIAKSKKRKRLYMAAAKDGTWHLEENQAGYKGSHD